MSSRLNKTRLPLLPQQALQHLSQWETLLGQSEEGLDVLQGHKEWCNLCLFSAYTRKCRHTDTFMHLQTHARAHTATLDACTYCSLNAKILACTNVLNDFGMSAMFLQAGRLSSQFGHSMTTVLYAHGLPVVYTHTYQGHTHTLNWVEVVVPGGKQGN